MKQFAAAAEHGLRVSRLLCRQCALCLNHEVLTAVAARHVDDAAAPDAVVAHDDLLPRLQEVGNARLHAGVACRGDVVVVAPHGATPLGLLDWLKQGASIAIPHLIKSSHVSVPIASSSCMQHPKLAAHDGSLSRTGAGHQQRVLAVRLEDVAQTLLDVVHDLQERRVQVACRREVTQRRHRARF